MNHKEKALELIEEHGYTTAIKIIDSMIKQYGNLKDSKATKRGLEFWENVKMEIEKQLEKCPT